ncbi:MAG TPA: glycosyltransferase family 2 protein [Candidatus Krumholzibacteria bacterium]
MNDGGSRAVATNGSPAPGAARAPITCVVLAQDSAPVIARCIRSLSFADDILVVDGGSRDDTVSIARALGARVIENPWPGFAAQRRFALQHATHDWVFSCDSDEEVPPALAAEIERLFSRPETRASAAGFRVPRRSQFLGAWMDVGPWSRDTPLRLFRAGAARVTDASVHEGIQVDGAVATLDTPLHHYTHTTLGESFRRLNEYTSLEARDRASRRRIRALDPLVSPAGVFFKYYVAKGCWRAGMRGYLLASITAIYKMVLYIKIRELQRGKVIA